MRVCSFRGWEVISCCKAVHGCGSAVAVPLDVVPCTRWAATQEEVRMSSTPLSRLEGTVTAKHSAGQARLRTCKQEGL